MFMSEHKFMVFEGDGGRVASNYWSCLGLLCVRGALRLFEREKARCDHNGTRRPAAGKATRILPRWRWRRCNAMRTARLTEHIHAQSHVVFFSQLSDES